MSQGNTKSIDLSSVGAEYKWGIKFGSSLCRQIPGSLFYWAISRYSDELRIGSANERWRYIVMSSLIGWAHTHDDFAKLDKFTFQPSIIFSNVLLRQTLLEMAYEMLLDI